MIMMEDVKTVEGWYSFWLTSSRKSCSRGGCSTEHEASTILQQANTQNGHPG